MAESPIPTAIPALSRTTSPINYLFLVEGCVAVIVAVAFLFYWNRLLGNGLSWCIRLYTWRKHNAYINIGSLQISPLAGRILFRDVHYHSSNLSLRVLHGHVTWRYWKRRVRQEGSAPTSKRKLLPCRISIFAEGVELFVFNRTPAYDAIVERMQKHEADGDEHINVEVLDGQTRLRKGFSNEETEGPPSSKERWSDDSGDKRFAGQPVPTRSNDNTTNHLKRSSTKAPKPTISWFREALPVELDILTGAIVLGNDATPMVLVIDFKEGNGTVEASTSRSPLDYYKFGVNFSFRAPKILMRTNTDYTGSLLNHGKRMYDKLSEANPDVLTVPPSDLSTRARFRQLASKLAFLYTPEAPSHPTLEHGPWKGLARYREGASGLAAFGRASHEVEYAKVTTLLDSPSVDVSFFYDEPGNVLYADANSGMHTQGKRGDELGNGDIAPEYGIDIVIHGGSVKYGPWADRQRDALQKAFAPSIFFNTEPHEKLQPGDKRVATALKLNIRLDEETVLRLPTRESSKDWQYDTRRGYQGKVRPYGWLDVKVGADSYITYVQSQVATTEGYDSLLELHLDGITIVTSVNMQTFMTADVCRLSLSMPTPLKWNEARTWGFDVTMDRPEIFLLRDHVTLIADLAKDWSSGSTGDFFHFVPNHYQFQVSLKNYALRMNLNDYNIVDRPTSLDDNAFAHLTGPTIGANVTIAAGKYRPEFSTIPFTVNAKNAMLCLSLPQWDTHASFETGRTADVGHIGDITVVGSYLYYSLPDPSHQETLTLDVKSTQVAFKCMGWVLRRLFAIKDNYFGSYTNFTTFSEFSERFVEDPKLVGDRVDEKYRPGRSDPFAVNLTVQVQQSRVILPENIFDCLAGVIIPVPDFQMTLRSLDEFMEMSIDLQPTYLSFFDNIATVYPEQPIPPFDEKEAIFIEGVEVKAHRLFGPQPRAYTYLCLWEIRIAAVQAHLTPVTCHRLQNVGRAFGYNFVDVENAPSARFVPPADPDVTFFKLEIDSMDVTILDSITPCAVVRASLPCGLQLDTSSLATNSFDSMLAVSLPLAQLSISHRGTLSHAWQEVASAASDLQIDLFKTPLNWQKHAAAQHAYVAEQDEPSRRVEVLYGPPSNAEGLTRGVVFLPRPHYQGDADENSVDFDLPSSERSSSISDISFSARHNRRSFTTARESASADSVGVESGEESDYEVSIGSSDHAADRTSDGPVNFARGNLPKLASRLRRLQHVTHGIAEGLPTPTSWQRIQADSSVIKIRSRLGVQLDAVPTAAIAVMAVVNKFLQIAPSSETILDQLLDMQVDAEVATTSTAAKLTLFDLALPCVAAQVTFGSPEVGNCAAANVALHIDSPAVLWEIVNGGALSQNRFASRVNIISMQLDSAVDQGQAVRLQDAGIQSLIPDATGDFLACRLVVTDVEVASSVAATATVTSHCHAIELHAVHQVVPIVEANRKALLSLIAKASPAVNRSMVLLQEDLVYLLHDAIQGDYSTANPKFMDVESYALHADGPTSIRRSLGWLTLGRFRRWLRQKEPTCRRLGAHTAKPLPFTAGGAVRRLANLKEWEPIDFEDVRGQAFLQAAFPDLREAPLQRASLQIAGNLEVGAAEVHIHGIDMEARQIVSTSLRVLACSVGLIYNNLESSDVLAIGTESLSFTGATNLLHLASTLQPTLLEMKKDKTNSPTRPVPVTNRNPRALSIHIREASIAVNASGLQAALRVEALQATAITRQTANERQPSALNYTIGSNVVTFRADGDRGEFILHPSIRSLIDLTLEGVNVCVDIPSAGHCGVLVSTNNCSLLSKPKLRTLITFIDEWRERHLAVYENALAQIGVFPGASTAHTVAAHRKERIKNRRLTFDIRLVQATVRVRASKALWLAWEIGGSVASVVRHAPNDVHLWSYAIKLGPEALGVVASSKAQAAGFPTMDSSTLLKLPWVRLSGSYGPGAASRNAQHIVNLSLGQITGTAKPALLERLLSVYEHLRHDLQGLISLWEAAAHKTEAISVPDSHTTATYQISVELQGLYFALRADGVASLVVLKAASLSGRVSNCTVPGQVGLSWSAQVKDLALALGRPSRVNSKHDAPFDSRHCSAYMILSVHVEEIPSVRSAGEERLSRDASLNINLTPVHAVMHVTAMGEALDLAKMWSAELSGLRARRTADLAEIRSQTTRVFRTLETSQNAPLDSSWFAQRTIYLQLAGIGIAVPLVEVDVMGAGSREAVPEFSALLLAIHSFSYTNRRNETARSNIQHLTLQFVSKFDQLNSEHFKSLAHQSKNKMSLPDLESQAQMSQESGHWKVFCHSTASGFQLGLAPNITDHVFALLELYETGRLRFALLEEQYRKDLATLYALDNATAQPKTPEKPASTAAATATMMIRASFVFNSGLVTLHPPGDVTATTFGRAASDSLRLPSISVWSTYDTSGKENDVDELVVNVAVHSSSNDINPTVLPFCHAIVRQIETHLNSAQERASKRHPIVLQLSVPAPVTVDAVITPRLSEHIPAQHRRRTRYQVSLRIDKSRLQFLCLEGSKAYAALEWDSGGFLMTHLAGIGGGSTLAGAVSGVSAKLGHTFRSETSFLTGQGKDLTFNVIATPSSPSQPIEVRVSADTELSVSLNMGLYFAWLGFIAVWWDTMPAIEIRRPASNTEQEVKPCDTAARSPSKVSVTFLVRVRQLDFDADVAITKANFQLHSLVASGSLGSAHKSLQITVAQVSASAQGDVAGRLQNTGLSLNTHRQEYEPGKEVADPVFLKMEVNTGEIELRLEVDHQTILRAHLADTLVSLADDWSGFAADHLGGRALKLAFAVDAGRFDGVITLLAIPLLLRRVDAISGILDDQKLQAVNDSPAFRARRASKTQNASKGIAAAMMITAKEHTKDFSPAHFKIVQAVRFDLAGVDLGVYSEDVHESDFYRFKIGRIGADQVRDENEDKHPERKVDLMVAYMTWETTDRGHAPKAKDHDLPVAQWIERAASHDRREVASLPALTLRMDSIEFDHPPVLDYDFDLIWGETDGDIAFLPNFFEAFKRTFDQLIEELDRVKVEQLADAQRRTKLDEIGKITTSAELEPGEATGDDDLALLVYRNRSTNPQHSLPRLKPLGEGTTDAARMLPMIKTGMAQIPVFSHRFMTLKLEDIMGFMLKLYEKQLDVKMDIIDEADDVRQDRIT